MERFSPPPLPDSDIYIRPVMPLLMSLISGIVMGVYVPGKALWIYPVAGLAALLALKHIVIKQPARFPPLLLFICLGYLSIQPFIAPDYPFNHVIHYLNDEKWQITGTVDQDPVIKNSRMQFVLRVHQLDFEGAHHHVIGKIKVTIPGSQLPALESGDTINFASRIRSIRNFYNPGGFNYERYMAFQQISGSAYARPDKLVVLEKKPGRFVQRAMTRYRNRISSLIRTTVSGDAGKILNALIIGKRTEVDASLADRFNRAGLGHLLAISGLHVGIVASAAFLGFTWLLSRFSFFLWRAWSRKGAAVLSVFPVLLYGILAGMSPSTQRAVLMVGVFLMTFPIEREQNTLNTLAIAALVILIISPSALFSISFQLSFTAVFFIIYGLPKPAVSGALGKFSWPAFKTKLVQFCSVSGLAIVGTLPLIMTYFNQISFAGFFANLIGIPMIGFIVVPVGIISAFVYPVSPLAAFWGFKLCGMVLEPALMFINTIAGLPFAATKTITPNLLELICIYLLLWCILHQMKNRSADPPVKAQASRWLMVLCSIALLCDIGYYIYQRYHRETLRITMLDVGQGTAALLELPKGYTILIDGGGFSDNAIFDVGERVLAPFLWRNKIITVDTIILSHPNCDHYNGLTYIAEHFNVKQAWTTGETSQTRSFKAFIQAIQNNHVFFPPYDTIPKHQEIAGVMVDILHPWIDDTWKDNNNTSIVIKVTFGKTVFLFPGDIMAKSEQTLVQRAKGSLKSTVLLAPHHGSRTSSTKNFLRAVNPDIVVISCGWKNRFHMPHETVLSHYRERGAQILRTDHHGAVTLISDGRNLKIDHVVDVDDFSAESRQAH